MTHLSAKQQDIYDYILSFASLHGYPPSVREIGEQMGLKSPSTVHFHLKALEERGYIAKAQGKTRAITILKPVEEEPPANLVPLVGHVAAGCPILAEEVAEDYIPFDTNGRTGEHFALTVRGDSMIDAGIFSGDTVIVHQGATFYNGTIVVALIDDEATVKTYRKKDGHLWLMPENPDYEPIDGTHAQILGKVVGLLRRYA